MKFSSIFTTLCLLATALTDDIHITSDTYKNGDKEITCDDVTIDKGVYWDLVNGEYIHFHGDFENNGDFFLTSDSEDCAINFKIDRWGNNVVNNGQMVVKSDENSFWSPKFRINGGSFENNGKLFVGGNGKAGFPVAKITPNNFHNNGVISLYQDKRNSGLVNLGQLWGTMHNDGTVCLRNQAFSQHSSIKGKGCFDIGENSNVWIKSAALPVSEDQTFFFSSTGGSMRVEAISAPQTFTVRNWGNGNIIGLSWPISGIRYSGDGILTLKCGLLEFHFDIGTGYDINKMKKITADFGQAVGSVINGGIVYDDPAPSSDRPEICQTCEEIPSPPQV